ncbi:PLC-like phosphodiesterase, partial [Schizopora paradoxa]
MPSKGVDYYSYIALPNTSIAFAGPDVGSTLTSADNFMKSHLEIDSGNLPWFTFTGTFDWDIDRNGMSIIERQQEINSLTGNLESGDFSFMMNTPAVLGPDYTVTYGFYDAGSGIAGLTNADQSWVTVVPKFSDWMGDVAPPNSSQEQQPFSTFVLAAAHDGGMNTMSGIDVVTSDPVFQTFIGALSLLIPVPGIATLLVSDAVHIMEDLAMTQKDTFTSMLDNGVRYFDFRPAYLLQAVQDIVPPMNNTLYHTHLVIPGARFDAFLSEVVSFLIAHPTEVVVTRISADGIQGVDIPDVATVSQFASAAVNGTNVLVGDSSCFQMPIGALRASGKRLIVVQNNPKYDSYSDAAYATLDPTPIIESFANMSTAGQAGNDFTVLQLQGTSTGITDVLIYGALIANGSTSTLMATKAQFDMVTLPWVRENALGNLTAQQNIILMNDFIDGATTHTALEMSQARFA